MKRKKVCPHCGRKLWLRSFYTNSNGTVSSYCSDCSKQQKRDWYNKNRKVPDGLRHNLETGRTLIKEGNAIRISWSPQMISDLRRLFPTDTNKEIAEYIGVSPRTVIRKARELGLEKDKEWLHEQWEANRRLAHFVSRQKGYPGGFQEHPEVGAPYRFKKGHQLTPEEKVKQSASMRAYYRRNPTAALMRGRKLMKPVLCVETGVVFESIRNTASCYEVCPQTISMAIKNGSEVKGNHFKLYENG